MYLIRINQKSPKTPFKVFAHRGEPQLAPENTIPALEAAAAKGANWVECDLQLTQDGEVVIFHDETVDRTTDGRGRLSDLSYAQVAKLDAGSWFDAKFSQTRIPTLAMWLQCAASLNLGLNLELKVVSNDQCILMATLLLQYLKQFWSSQLPVPLISSTSLYALQCVARESEATLPLALISDEQISENMLANVLLTRGFFSIHHKADCLTKPYVDWLHDHGFQVYAYTVNEIAEVESVRNECGIDGVFTDNHELYVLHGLS